MDQHTTRRRRPSRAPAVVAAPSEAEATRLWLHDNPLQILDYIATGGYAEVPDVEHLRAVAAQEADRLRAFIEQGRAPVRALGLGDRLAEIVRAQQRLAAHRIRLDTEQLADTVPEPYVTALTEAGREALTNARKHAGARLVTVTCRAAAGVSSVVVEDDGHGFDTREVPTGHGLRSSIEARMNGVGGVASVISSPGHGTTVVLTAFTAPAFSAGRAA